VVPLERQKSRSPSSSELSVGDQKPVQAAPLLVAHATSVKKTTISSLVAEEPQPV